MKRTKVMSTAMRSIIRHCVQGPNSNGKMGFVQILEKVDQMIVCVHSVQ